MSRFLATALVFSLPTALGCSAEAPDETMSGPDAGVWEETPRPKPEVELGDIASSWVYTSLPVRGQGPENGTLIVDTAVTSKIENIRSDGTFCIDVPLQQGVMNTLWFKAMDVHGVYSDEIEVTVRQDGDPPTGDNEEDNGAPTYRNVARFGDVDLRHEIKEGQREFLNDGDENTFAMLSNRAFGHSWIRLKVTDPQAPIDHIRVRSASDCYLERYRVLVTDDPEAGAPCLDPTYCPSPTPWWEIADITSGTGDDIIKPPFDSQWKISDIYIVTHKGGGSCQSFWQTSNFEVLEIEAFAVEDGLPPSNSGPQGPTCASGAPN